MASNRTFAAAASVVTAAVGGLTYAYYASRAAYAASHALVPPNSGPRYKAVPVPNMGQSCYATAVVQMCAAVPPVGMYIHMVAPLLSPGSTPHALAVALDTATSLISPLLPPDTPAPYPATVVKDAMASLLLALSEAVPSLDVTAQQDPVEILHLIFATLDDALDAATDYATTSLAAMARPHSGMVVADAPRGAHGWAAPWMAPDSAEDDTKSWPGSLWSPSLPLRGLLLSSFACPHCDAVHSLSAAPFTDLGIPLATVPAQPGRARSAGIVLESALAHVLGPRPADTALCLDCADKVALRESRGFAFLPQVLAIHIQRTTAEPGVRGRLRKDNTPLLFGPTLDVGQFAHYAAPDKALYQLSAVVVHHGARTHRGHYTTFRRVPAWCVPPVPASASSSSSSPSSSSTVTDDGDVWVHISDHVSDAVPEASVLRAKPSILVYERMATS